MSYSVVSKRFDILFLLSLFFLFSYKAYCQMVPVRIASANLSQKNYDLKGNTERIFSAIKAAAENDADILSLQELTMTAYSADDYHKRHEHHEQIWIELYRIAQFAKQLKPDLVISLGFPVMIPGQAKPYLAQGFVSHGTVQAISLKSVQPDGPAEYEPRQFAPWGRSWEPSMFELPEELFGSQSVPIGNVILGFRDQEGNQITLAHEQCAEAWEDIGDFGPFAGESRRLIAKAPAPLSIVLNPSGSKPEVFTNKQFAREYFSRKSFDVANVSAYVYTNALGNESGQVAYEGGSVYVDHGLVKKRTKRYPFGDIEYSSVDFKIPSLPKQHFPQVKWVMRAKKFSNPHSKAQGHDDSLENSKHSAYEQTLRNISLWLRDYLLETKTQGFVISLSGGADSAFGAVALSTMLDLQLQHELERSNQGKQDALVNFLKRFSHLTYKDEVLDLAKKDVSAAIDLLKYRMFSFIYLPSENSSKTTLESARFLIEGGHGVKGIGGKFSVHDVQTTVDEVLLSSYSFNKSKLEGTRFSAEQAKQAINQYIATGQTLPKEIALCFPQDKNQRAILPPSWPQLRENPKLHHLELLMENLQSRARLPFPWVLAARENKIPCVTSNLSEAIVGYTAFGGDYHMGGLNIIGGLFKSELLKILVWLEKEGLDELSPISSLHKINKLQPSAELRPTKDGEVSQFDEEELMPYEQLDIISKHFILGYRSALETYLILSKSPLFKSPEDLASKIEKIGRLWTFSQFKRVAGPITPYLGQNVDPHQSVRTTVFSHSLPTSIEEMKSYIKTVAKSPKFAIDPTLIPEHDEFDVWHPGHLGEFETRSLHTQERIDRFEKAVRSIRLRIHSEAL